MSKSRGEGLPLWRPQDLRAHYPWEALLLHVAASWGRKGQREERSVSPCARLAFTTVSPAPEGLQQVFVEGVNEWVGES